MNNLEEQKLTVLEVQISDELSAEELDVVSGGGQCQADNSGGFIFGIQSVVVNFPNPFGNSGGRSSKPSKGKK